MCTLPSVLTANFTKIGHRLPDQPDRLVAMPQQPPQRIRTIIKSALPRAQVVLVGSRFYEEARPDSDYDLLVLSTLPVRRSVKQQIIHALQQARINYDIHFVPRLFVYLGWKQVAGRDLDSGQNIPLRLTRRVRTTVRANQIKMCYYHLLTGDLHRAALALMRARLLPHAETDRDIFCLAGSRKLIDRIHDQLSEQEISLYKRVLSSDDTIIDDDRNLLLDLINETFTTNRNRLFRIQHNLQYYAYSFRRRSLHLWVDYNRVITTALHHFVNARPDAAITELEKLTPVTSLRSQLLEYAQLSVLEIKCTPFTG